MDNYLHVELCPSLQNVQESMTCRKTMCAQPKLIPDISPGQSSWTAKVVVAEKNIARTAQRSPFKYQTMVLVDPQVVQTKNGTESHIQEVVLINERAAANKERLDEIVSQKSYLESSMFVKVYPPAKHKICKIKDIPVLLSEAYIQIKDCTGCIDATIMGEMAEAFLRSTAITLMNLTTPDKQSFIQAIRTSVDEEQILYVRATERDAEGTIVKYDVVYMFDPVTELDEPLVPSSAANNIVKSQPEHISRINKGKQILKPVQRALFSLKDSDSSQGEEDGMPSATAIFNHSTVVMADGYKFISDIGIRQRPLTSKVVVTGKCVPKTSHDKRLRYQNLILVDLQTTFLTAWDEFVVNECKTVTTMVGAAPIILARNLRVSSFNGKIRLCQLCGILLYPEAKVHVQVEDHTGCVSANMIGETAETFLQCSGQKLMQIAALDILNDIRASTTEEHMVYQKVINNNKKTVALKYDVVFMLEPILDINTALNIGENPVRGFMVEEKSAHRTYINKQPIKAYAQPMLSPKDPVSGRNNAIHTCFQTNTVIASRNITDLRLVANIANQKFMMADTNDGARIVKPWTVIVANLPVRIENNIRVDNCSINLERRWKRQ
ncbi:Uncharacterized protein Fot_21083 [Forsythia ovata]|uniref:Uncharacterized protein n=1 Tax=Forsythia ovata TaxID=205694 RepID=A0ABD1UTY7_9LAMI